jgi:hypothetical protein
VIKVTGRVTVAAPGNGTPVPAIAGQPVASGSTIDATRGKLVIRAPRDLKRPALTQTISLEGGPVAYYQQTDKRLQLMVFRLTGRQLAFRGTGCHCRVLTRDAYAGGDGDVSWSTRQTGSGTTIRLLSGRVAVMDAARCVTRRLPQTRAKDPKTLTVRRAPRLTTHC